MRDGEKEFILKVILASKNTGKQIRAYPLSDNFLAQDALSAVQERKSKKRLCMTRNGVEKIIMAVTLVSLVMNIALPELVFARDIGLFWKKDIVKESQDNVSRR